MKNTILLLPILFIRAVAADPATVLVRGFLELQGIASDPQGVPFFGSAGKIIHILARNLTLPLGVTRLLWVGKDRSRILIFTGSLPEPY
jgi:hypothetical protein